MIKQSDIKSIIAKASQDGHKIEERDIAFLVLRRTMPEDTAFRALYSPRDGVSFTAYKTSQRVKYLEKELVPYGIGENEFDDISRAENKGELIKLLSEVQKAREDGVIGTKDALKLETDIRVKLNDKFDMEESDSDKRIIVVPQKHDIVCPHTHHECTYMPKKEACMKYYKLKE